jgi:hypothetical protein
MTKKDKSIKMAKRFLVSSTEREENSDFKTEERKKEKKRKMDF